MTSLCSLCRAKPVEVACACETPRQCFCAKCYTDHVNQTGAQHNPLPLDKSAFPPSIEMRSNLLDRYISALQALEQIAHSQATRAQELVQTLERGYETQEERVVRDTDVACEVMGKVLSTAYQSAAEAIGPVACTDVPAALRKALIESEEKVIRLEAKIETLKLGMRKQVSEDEEERSQAQTLERETSDLKAASEKLLIRLGRVENECAKLRGERDRAMERLRATNQKTQYLEQRRELSEVLEAEQAVCPNCQVKTWPGTEPWRAAACSSTPQLAAFISDFCSENCYKRLCKELGYVSLLSRLFG